MYRNVNSNVSISDSQYIPNGKECFKKPGNFLRNKHKSTIQYQSWMKDNLLTDENWSNSNVVLQMSSEHCSRKTRLYFLKTVQYLHRYLFIYLNILEEGFSPVIVQSRKYPGIVSVELIETNIFLFCLDLYRWLSRKYGPGILYRTYDFQLYKSIEFYPHKFPFQNSQKINRFLFHSYRICQPCQLPNFFKFVEQWLLY